MMVATTNATNSEPFSASKRFTALISPTRHLDQVFQALSAVAEATCDVVGQRQTAFDGHVALTLILDRFLGQRLTHGSRRCFRAARWDYWCLHATLRMPKARH